MKISAVLILSLVLCACAGSYEPSEAFLSMRGKITRPQAVTLLQAMSNQAGGDAPAVICQLGTAYGVDQNTQLRFTESGFSYHAYTKGRFVREERGVRYFEKDYFEKAVPFDEISTVRILPYHGTECQTATAGKFDHIIVLEDNPFRVALSIAVKKNDLEQYLAAISSLTGNPRIVQGGGL